MYRGIKPPAAFEFFPIEEIQDPSRCQLTIIIYQMPLENYKFYINKVITLLYEAGQEGHTYNRTDRLKCPSCASQNAAPSRFFGKELH